MLAAVDGIGLQRFTIGWHAVPENGDWLPAREVWSSRNGSAVGRLSPFSGHPRAAPEETGTGTSAALRSQSPIPPPLLCSIRMQTAVGKSCRTVLARTTLSQNQREERADFWRLFRQRSKTAGQRLGWSQRSSSVRSRSRPRSPSTRASARRRSTYSSRRRARTTRPRSARQRRQVSLSAWEARQTGQRNGESLDIEQ